MPTYVLYRHGANKANQPGCDRLPVAIVTAPNRAAACAAERYDPPGRLDPYAPAYACLAPHIAVWANQRLSAVPLSRASKADVRALQEDEAADGIAL